MCGRFTQERPASELAEIFGAEPLVDDPGARFNIAPSDPVTGQPGWWKIRYNMSGLATDLSTDLTTWKVDIRGNPVHLLIP